MKGCCWLLEIGDWLLAVVGFWFLFFGCFWLGLHVMHINNLLHKSKFCSLCCQRMALEKKLKKKK